MSAAVEMVQPWLLAPDAIWVPVRDANPSALALFHRHYSYKPYRDGRRPRHFVGPGEKLVLLTPVCDALFVWRKFICGDGQQGVNCAIFRNEGPALASGLIRAAEEIAWRRWPGERFYTYVNPGKVERKRQPGRCFLKAGWHYVRREDGGLATTKHRGLLILEKVAPEAAKLRSALNSTASSVSTQSRYRQKNPVTVRCAVQNSRFPGASRGRS